MNRTAVAQTVILGAGGHARVLIDSLKASALGVPRAAVDPNTALWGREILDVPIVGGDDWLVRLRKKGVRYFAVGVGSTGDARVRERLFRLGLKQGLTPLLVRHKSALVSDEASLGPGTQVLARAVVNVFAVVGQNSIINTGAIVEHDCVLEDHVHIATGAVLSGNVHVGRGAHVGCGAAVREGVCIGPYATIGAGAAVVRDVPPGATVAGVPARKLERRAA